MCEIAERLKVTYGVQDRDIKTREKYTHAHRCEHVHVHTHTQTHSIFKLIVTKYLIV